jgi:signal transduction histidine kinase
MRWSEILRSSAFRRAIFFAFAIAVANAVVFAFVYLNVSNWEVIRLTEVLTSEVARSSAGITIDQLRQDLNLRLTQDLRHVDYAALYDAKGRLIQGNVAELPSSVPVDGHAHYIEMPGAANTGGEKEPSLFVAGRTPDGGILLLGRSLYEVGTLRHIVLEALGVAIIPTLILVFVIAVFFSLRAIRRLKSIHQTIDRIMDGNFRNRLPLDGRHDEIDDVVGAVNRMLDEILRLLNQLKAVGDNIAHDLRTPLAIVSARLNRVLNEGDAPELQKAVKQSLTDLDKAMTTVAALLRISEIENWSRRSAFKDIDVAEICREVGELYGPLAEARWITLSTDAVTPVIVHGDADLLREALINLVDNAIKFTPRDGSVTIGTEQCAQGPIIRVADSGRGIAPEEREKVLKRFYRAPEARAQPGNGLGLSMVATIAELHGLSLRIGDNHPGAVIELAPRRDAPVSGSPDRDQ